MYWLVQLVTILRESTFQRSAQYIDCNHMYIHLIAMYNMSTPLKTRFPQDSDQWYILWCACLCPFIAVSYYSMVGSDITQCYCFHSWVHTIRSQDKPSTYLYVLRQTWYIPKYNSMFWDKRGAYWYIPIYTYTSMQYWFILVYTSIYSDKPGIYWYIPLCTRKNLKGKWA
jgi:hypothetical protein